MSRADLSVIGVSGGARPYRAAASATKVLSGEPVMFAGSLSSGVASVNTVVALTDAKPVIGTDSFVGVAHEDMQVDSSDVVVASRFDVVVPIPHVTRIRGKAKTVGNVDTDSELLGVLWDVVLFDLTSSKYTIDETAAADTSALTIVDGIIAKGLLDVVVDIRAFRADIS